MEGNNKDLRRKSVRAYLAEDHPEYRDQDSFRNGMPGDLPSGRKRRRGPMLLLFILVMAASLSIGFVAGMLHHRPFASAETTSLDKEQITKKLGLLEQFINSYYLDEVDQEKMRDGIYKGYISGLNDRYAEYYTEDSYKQLMEEDSGEYQGIGVTVTKDPSTGYTLIEGVFKNTPAAEAGLEPGDYIISVNDRDTKDMELTEVVSEIKRKDKAIADLKVFREGQELEFSVKKSKIEIDTVTYEMKDGKIGYIEVTQFIDNTADQFSKAIDDLKGQGMTSLIIDLRDNGGGLVDSCVNMCSEFVPEGELVVYIQDKNGGRTDYKSNSNRSVDIPIVILINENTASASEIMTGCLRDYGLAKTVGTKTFGKGIVQNIFPLSDGTAVKFTVAKYYLPKGDCIHEQGIEPDVKVEMTDEEKKAALDSEARDKQLQKALELLKK